MSQHVEAESPWLENAPEGWRAIRAKRLLRETKDLGHSDEPLLSVTQAHGVIRRDESETRVWNPGSDVSSYKLVRPGEFVISLRSFEGGLERSETRGIVSPAYTPLRPERISEDQARFLAHFFKSRPFVSALQPLTSGIRQGKNISFDDLGEMLLPVPPEQVGGAIANFLDRETEKIDTLIAKKERLLELLDEKRTALITQAVTKGLDPDVPMKDSGVEWLGEIPEHWEVVPVKRVVRRLTTGVSVRASQSGAAGPDETGVLKTSSVYGDVFRPEENKLVDQDEVRRVQCPVRGGTVLVSRMNTPELVASAAYVGKDYSNLFLPDRLWEVEPKVGKCIPEFLWMVFRVPDLRRFLSRLAVGASGSMRTLAQEDFLGAQIPLPPESDQRRIAESLKVSIAGVSEVSVAGGRAIGLLAELRQALVSAAVTGQIEVTSETTA